MMCLLFLNACSFFASSRQSITIMSNIPDSEIYVNAQKVGVGVTQTLVKREAGTQIMAKKEGYHSAYYTLDRELRTIGYIDIIGGCFWWIPFIGLLAPGAYAVYPKNIVLELVPIQNK